LPDAVTFPGVAGPVPAPSRPAWRKRLPYLALAAVNRLVPKVPGKVVLHSTVDVEDGVLAVAEELAARGHRATVLLEKPHRGAVLRSVSPVPVRAVPKWSARGLAHYLTARHVMTTSNIHGNVRPPRSQNVVALWHGEPPSKATGLFEGSGGLRASYAPVCSTVGRAYRSAELDVHPLRVPIVGAPRNDRMLRVDAAAVRRTLLGDDAGRTTFLWMPSYRMTDFGGLLRTDAAGAGPPFPPHDVRRLDDWLAERGARVVVKVHHRDVDSFSGDHRALRVLRQGELEQRGLTIYQALAAFDALITDMSSVWVDYLLLDKPIIYAFPDVEAYRTGRGLNLEPYEQWVPGPFARTTDELLHALGDVVHGRDPMADERRRARLRFHQFHDDASAARLLDGLGLPPRTGTAVRPLP
jgi:CDP-glycerol glycerophosphotransferase